MVFSSTCRKVVRVGIDRFKLMPALTAFLVVEMRSASSFLTVCAFMWQTYKKNWTQCFIKLMVAICFFVNALSVNSSMVFLAINVLWCCHVRAYMKHLGMIPSMNCKCNTCKALCLGVSCQLLNESSKNILGYWFNTTSNNDLSTVFFPSKLHQGLEQPTS